MVRYTRSFRYGDHGADIEAVGRALCLAGEGISPLVFAALPTSVRRTWGRRKQKWLSRFKRKHGLSGAPTYGKRTHAALSPHFDTRARVLMNSWQPPAPPKSHPIPLGVDFSIIGYPWQGTHNAADWQSGNALDFRARSGTPILAPRAGRVVRVGGSDGIRYVGVKIIFGRKFTIVTDEGPDIFMTHLTALRVSENQHIKAGQIVGKIGYYGTGSHVHIGFESGDPRQLLDWPRQGTAAPSLLARVLA